MNILQISQLTCGYSTENVLQNLDLAMAQNEILCLLEPVVVAKQRS